MKSFKEYLEEDKIPGIDKDNRKPGKVMGNDTWVHKDYTKEAGFPQDHLENAKKHIGDHEYHIVKHNKKDNSFSFIHSPDFETSHEPISGKSVKVTTDGKVSTTPQTKDPKIYHGKWQFVPNEHKGFDVEHSKNRHKHWKGVIGVDKGVSSRIGSKKYWEDNVTPKLKGSEKENGYNN
jgi:hypothetical protein